jgi:hypothetical protein
MIQRLQATMAETALVGTIPDRKAKLAHALATMRTS